MSFCISYHFSVIRNRERFRSKAPPESGLGKKVKMSGHVEVAVAQVGFVDLKKTFPIRHAFTS
jgi:hypothetical protein